MPQILTNEMSSKYTDFCQALEAESFDVLMDFKDQINSIQSQWNRSLNRLIYAKQNGSDRTAAIEGLINSTRAAGYPIEQDCNFEDLWRRSEWISMLDSAIETEMSNRMDYIDADVVDVCDDIFETCVESVISDGIGLDELSLWGVATEGTNIDAFNMIRELRRKTSALKKEMNAAKKAKKWGEAAEKALEIARNADEIAKRIDNLPSSMGSAAIVGIILFLVSLAAIVGASNAAAKIGGEIGAKRNVERNREKIEYDSQVEGNTKASEYRESVSEARRKEIGAKYKQKYEEDLKAANARNAQRAAEAPKAPKEQPKGKGGTSFSLKLGKKEIKIGGKPGQGADQKKTIAETVDSKKYKKMAQDEFNKEKEYIDIDAYHHGERAKIKEAERLTEHYQEEGKYRGEAIGGFTTMSAMTLPVVVSQLSRLIKGKKVIDENGNPKKVPLDANEWNALVRYAKHVAESVKKQYLKKAKEFKARTAASEAFVYYMCYTDPALEGYFDEGGECELEIATEGVNAESIDIWRTHNKEIAKLRKEMKAAVEAGDPKVAADRAKRISAKCNESLKMLEALPQSRASAMLPKIIIWTITALVGVKVGPWIGQAGGKMIGKNMMNAASKDMPKFLNKPLQEIAGFIFGVAGAFMPGVFAFKQLMAFLRGKVIVNSKGEVSTTKISPNEVNVIMNMAKSSIRTCQRKYDNLAREFEAKATEKDRETTMLDKKGAEESFSYSDWVAIESALYEELGLDDVHGSFDSFLTQFC